MPGFTHMQTGMISGLGWPLVKPLHGRLSGFLVLLLFLAIVSGVEAIIANALAQRWRMGDDALVLVVVALLVLLLCLAMLLATVYSGLVLFLPRAEVRSPMFKGRAGEKVAFQWSFRRAPTRIRVLKILLEGYEERRKGHGKNDPWKRTTVFTQNLMESTCAAHFAAGELKATIPSEAMPTCMERTYRMRWVVSLQGQVPLFPDLNESYEIIVLPAGQAST